MKLYHEEKKSSFYPISIAALSRSQRGLRRSRKLKLRNCWFPPIYQYQQQHSNSKQQYIISVKKTVLMLISMYHYAFQFDWFKSFSNISLWTTVLKSCFECYIHWGTEGYLNWYRIPVITGAIGLVKNNLKQHLQVIKGSPAIEEVQLCVL